MRFHLQRTKPSGALAEGVFELADAGDERVQDFLLRGAECL